VVPLATSSVAGEKTNVWMVTVFDVPDEVDEVAATSALLVPLLQPLDSAASPSMMLTPKRRMRPHPFPPVIGYEGIRGRSPLGSPDATARRRASDQPRRWDMVAAAVQM
jgi:hypothetical protein